MKIFLVALITSVFLLCASNYAGALPIRYNITGGVDTEGYSFSGYVDIDSNPTSALTYNISSFLFVSCGGINYGSSGELLFRFADPIKNVVYPGSSTAHFYSDYIVNYVGKDNLITWTNAATGVWFVGVEPTFDAYSNLPEQIEIWTYFMAGGYDRYNFWGPVGGSKIVLDRASCPVPVPEPATMIILGAGLLGLAGYRRKAKR